MGVFDWWRGRKEQLDADVVSKALIGEATDLVVKIANPRLVLVRRYRERLAGPIERMIVYLREGDRVLLPAREASAAVWAGDPVLRAFFARPDELVRAFSRSIELRRFFDSAPERTEAHAVLGMALREQRVLGTRLHGEVVQHDVMQTTVSFADYRVGIVAATEPELRREIGRRVLEQLALRALERVHSIEDHGRDLEEHRALLKSRQMLLQQGAAGMKAVVGDNPRPREEELHKIEAMLEENERDLKAPGIGPGALERELEVLVETLTHASEGLKISSKRLRLDSMNNLVEADSPEQGREIEFNVFEIAGSPPIHRVGALVRFSRAELMSRESLLREAEQSLG